MWLSCVQITQPKPYSLTTKFSYLCSLVPQVAVDKLQWMVVMNELSSSNCKTRKKIKKITLPFYILCISTLFSTLGTTIFVIDIELLTGVNTIRDPIQRPKVHVELEVFIIGLHTLVHVLTDLLNLYKCCSLGSASHISHP